MGGPADMLPRGYFFVEIWYNMPEVREMALREIRKSGDEILRKKSREIQEVTDRVRTILDDMAETMYHAEGGGLAACQVGILKRLVVIDIGEGLLKLVNPEFVLQKGEQIVEEGCLSFPDVWGRLKRPERVVVRALDENGKEITVEGTGLLAKCLCHELDHLDGIVFKDKIIEFTE
ncbi:peptide deformylase [Christensenella minuta]|uniref:Peptide deformylase n=2 Tax=Christensenella minuta TaxID=626937 RepID=A0A136Q3F2_9FIRM|nr:peptide deformylase [Christensenella minuta]